MKARKVEVIDVMTDDLDEGGLAIFHRFVTESDINGTYAVAIVERSNGTVETPLATSVRFVDSDLY